MKKKIVLCALFALSLLTLNVFAIDGDGSVENPFLITTQEELELINDFPSHHFKLNNDIVLENNWVPLCTYGDSFTGTFDGLNHLISNLQITGNYKNAGLFAENNGTIKNVKIETTESGVVFNEDTFSDTYIGILTAKNNGIIENCHIKGYINHTNNKYSTGGSGNTSKIKGYAGGIAANNTGNIDKSSADINIVLSMYRYFETSVKKQYGGTAYAGGITGYNSGNITLCNGNGNIKITSSYYSYVGGIVGKGENGSVTNSYFNGTVDEYAYTHGLSYLGHSGGIIGYGPQTLTNCYAVSTGNNYGIGENITVKSCFYDKSVSGLTDFEYGEPKSTMAMKINSTYLDWDFKSIWSISAEKNNGYPYLQWEYSDNETIDPSVPTEPETNITNIQIIKAISTANSLKTISIVDCVENNGISSFGTAFIPLWLFETGATNTAIVQYDASTYNISNAQTFGATLSGIPSIFKDMAIVGKSFIKDTYGNYIWSDAKYASINDATLKTVE